MSDDLHPLVEVADEASARPVAPQAVGVAPVDSVENPPGFLEALGGLAGSGPGFWLVNLVNFTDGIAYFGILGILVNYFSDDLHIPDKFASMYVSLLTGLVALLMVPGGRVCDSLGIRTAISLSLVLGTLGRAGLWACHWLPSSVISFGLILSIAVMAFATGILQTALYAGVKETTTTRLASMGFSVLYALMNLGIVVESFFSPFIRSKAGLNLGYGAVIGLMAAITFVQLLVHVVFFPKATPADPQPPQEGAGPIGSQQGDGPANPLADPRFLFFIFILLPVRTLFAHQWLTIPGYITRCFDQAVADRFEWFNMINPAVIFVAVPIICHLTARVHVLKMMIAGTAVSALATFCLSLPPDVGRLVTYLWVFSLGEALWASRFLEYVAKIAPPGRLGAYMGVANLPWFLAKFTTGLYSGYMLTRYIPAGEAAHHPEALWTLYGFIACISPVGLLLAYPWLRAGDKEKAN